MPVSRSVKRPGKREASFSPKPPRASTLVHADKQDVKAAETFASLLIPQSGFVTEPSVLLHGPKEAGLGVELLATDGTLTKFPTIALKEGKNALSGIRGQRLQEGSVLRLSLDKDATAVYVAFVLEH